MTIQLTVFYDHSCPFCRAEMMRIARWDTRGRLRLIDFSAPQFNAGDFGLTHAALNRELHGVTAAGEVLRGLACVRRVYELTRFGVLWRVTALPGLKPVFDRFYLWFARNRQALSVRPGYAKTCPDHAGASYRVPAGAVCPAAAGATTSGAIK